jgi:hypothetical protein
MGLEASLDAGDQYDNYSWSSGATEQSIKTTQSGTYWVSASRNNSVCVVADTVELYFSEPYMEDNICLVTTDLTTGDNLIVWEKTQDKGTAAYHIYRQTNVINEYEIIGTVPYDKLSVFLDTVADPEQQQWVYKITAVDTCGNISDVSEAVYHRPLFLQYQSSNDGVNLKWEKYEVEGGSMDFVSYIIYRGSDSTSLEELRTVSADLNVFNDNDPNALRFRYFYRVAGVRREPCYPSGDFKAGTGPYSHSLSNLEDNKLKETQTSVASQLEIIPLEIYPNPMDGYTRLRFSNPDHEAYSISIRDFAGKLLRTEQNIRSEEYTLYREDLASGYYFIEIKGNKLYRGRLVIR